VKDIERERERESERETGKENERRNKRNAARLSCAVSAVGSMHFALSCLSYSIRQLITHLSLDNLL